MANFNKTMYWFEKNGDKYGIRCELYSDWYGLYPYDIDFWLYRVKGNCCSVDRFNPSPSYVRIDNGHGVENGLPRSEYQKLIRELYPDECKRAGDLFVQAFLNDRRDKEKSSEEFF